MKTGLSFIFFLLSFLPFAISSTAQNLYFKHYVVEDGLSNNIVTSCHQDSQGFMWFGTRDGLNRFDGYSFRVFRFDSMALNRTGGSNAVRSMVTDEQGQLWVGTATGVYTYNALTEEFNLLPFSNGMNAKELTFSSEGDLWLILDGKLVNYHLKLDTFMPYQLPDNAPVSSFCISPSGIIWVATTNGMLYKLNPQNGTNNGFDLFENNKKVTDRTITKVRWAYGSDMILVGTFALGAKLFDPKTETNKDLFEEDTNVSPVIVRDFLQVSPNVVWTATESGLFIYDLATDTYSVVKCNTINPYSLSNNSLFCMCKDKEDGVWVGTYAGGINYLSPFNPFDKFYEMPGDDNSMKGAIVHDICTDSFDNLWIATEDAGLNKLNEQTGIYSNYTFPEVNLHGLVVDGSFLWVASLFKVYVLDIKSDRIVRSYDFSGKGSLVALKKLPNGMLLAGTTTGAYCFNPVTNSFDFMPQFSSGHRVQCFFEDRNGLIYAGTVNNGVHYFNPKDGSFGRFVHDTLPGDNSNTINDIYQDEMGNMWFATLFGIRRVENESGIVTRYTTDEGLPSNVTFRILSDEMDHLWISTTGGLVALQPKTESISVFTHDHGLITNQFNYNSSWKDSQGRLYFGMVKGMVRFYPSNLLAFSNTTKPYLTNITLLSKQPNTPASSLPVAQNRSIVLESDQSSFYIDYSTLSYIAPNSTSFAYCMEGIDNDKWTYTNGHSAYYTQLPHGNYVFHIRATNTLGNLNDYTTSLKISIKRPWWLSIGAKTFYILVCLTALFILVFLIVRKNKRRIRQSIKQLEYDKEKELYQSKFNFFINVAHEIRTPLTLIKSPLEKVMHDQHLTKESFGYLSVVEKNADRLLALVNQLLDFRKTEMEGFRLSFVKIDVVALLQDHYFRFKDTADQKQLQFTLTANMNSFFVFADKDALTKIISNLLSNALKYAESFIYLSLLHKEDDPFFNIDVTNDGEPIEDNIKEKIFEPFYRGKRFENKSGSGLGLPLARSLTQMHRGTLYLSNNTSHSITFRLHLPVCQPDSVLLQNEVGKALPPREWTPPEVKEDESKLSLLLVEDNLEMLSFVCGEVSKQYNVFSATNGEEALAILKKHVIHLVITDIMMPVMDGCALLNAIKSNLEYSHIPVVLLTAKSTIQSRIEGLELGADAYIEKPFSMDVLSAQIANLLNNRNNIRDYYFNSPIAHLKSMAYSKADEDFLEKMNAYINDNLDNVNLDVDSIAEKMNISRPTLYRKISAISNSTPNELIRLCRLKKAAEYILEGEMSLSSIADAVGFSSQSYFSRSFTKQFNTSPSEYAKSAKKQRQTP